MGTQNLTIVIDGGKHVVAQYGQWDGYPSGQGITALSFCRDHLATKEGVDEFRVKLKAVRFVSDQEIRELYASVGVDGSKKSLTYEEANRFADKYPYFTRDNGASILEMIEKAGGAWERERLRETVIVSLPAEVLVRDYYDFAADSLFCEWAYCIDLDRGELEVYEGGNQTPLDAGERFASLPRKVSPKTGEPSEYHPVKFARRYRLDDLPSDAAFLRDLEKDGDA